MPPLPTSRDVTLVADAEVPSSLLNNLQDCIVGGKHGAKTKTLAAATANANATSGFQYAATAGSGNDELWESLASTDETVVVPLNLDVGDRLVSVKAWVQAVGGTVSIRLYKEDLSNGTETQLGSTATSSGTTRQALTVTPTAPGEVVASGFKYWLAVLAVTTTSAKRFWGGEMVYEHP